MRQTLEDFNLLWALGNNICIDSITSSASQQICQAHCSSNLISQDETANKKYENDSCHRDKRYEMKIKSLLTAKATSMLRRKALGQILPL